MASDNQYRVNWVDGMKMNKNHFIDLENSVLATLQQTQLFNVTPSNFGLLPILPDEENSLDMTMSVDGQSSINVTLHSCRALTMGGILIHISKEMSSMLEQSGHRLHQIFEVDKDDQEWYIVLVINPSRSIPFGPSRPEEVPPRHPYVTPEFRIEIVPINETSQQEMGQFHLNIGKVINKDGTLAVDSNFIPPCTSMQSHPDLKFAYNEIGTFLNQMELFCVRITQKIYQKKQTNDLANIALHLSLQIIQYLNAYLIEYRTLDKNEAPIKIFSKLGGLARVIRSSFDVFVGTGKEDFLNYLTEWCDLNQGAIEGVLLETIDMQYVHSDINFSLQKISSFTKHMLTLFKKLSELDYIGKKPDTGIFVKEEVVKDKEIKGRRSFLLD